MSKKKYKKEINPAKRILISAASTVVVVGAVGGTIYHFVKAGRDKPQVYVDEGPNIDSKPGLGTPTKIYNDAQIDENMKNAVKAKKEITSNVPTLTNTDFNGDISSFLSSSQADAQQSCPVSGSQDFKKNPNTCTVPNLVLARKAGVSAAELICQSCPVKALRDAGYTVGDLKNGGHSAQELKDAGYSLADLIAAGYSPAELLKAGFSAESLRAMGLSADQLAAAGCTYQDLLSSGISPELAKKAIENNESGNREALADARDSGVLAETLLKQGIPLKVLKEAGYSARELMNAGATLKQLKDIGFTAMELARAGYSVESLKNAGFSAADLEKVAAIAKQCEIAQLKEAHKKGVPVSDLLKVCNAEALRAAGYTLNELVRAGVDPKKLHEAGYSAKDMLAAGYDAKSLLDAGYTVKSLKDAGVSLASLVAMGVTPAQLIKAGFNRDQLDAQGIGAQQLLRSGLTPTELRQAGFSATELSAAGANAGSLKSAGFSASDLRQAGFTASQMRQAGFSAKELRDAGYGIADLKIAGYTAGDLLRAGFTDTATPAPTAQAAAVNPKASSTSAPQNVSNLPNFGSTSSTDRENLELEKLRAIQKYQQEQLDKTQKEALLQNTASKMASQARSLMSDWSNVSNQSLTPVDVNKDGGLLGKYGKDGSPGKDKATGPTFKAGTIMYATLDTSIDSDEQTPIMGTIISGELKGSKLIGNFKRVDKKVLLTFNLLNIPSFKRTVSFNGVAIDPSTSRTAISGSVDSHYWLKYGTAFAAAFLQGVGSAVGGGTSNCQVWNPGGVSDPWCQTIYSRLNVTQSALVGLGQVGQTLSNQLQKDFGNLPPTVKIPGGTAFGLLFMSDLTLPQPLPKADPLTNMNNLMGDNNE